MFNRKIWGGLVIAVVALIAYFPALKIDFIVPDWTYLEIAAGFDFQHQVARYFDPRLLTYGFRPLQGFQIILEYYLFRDDHTGYHLIPILFHAVNCLLLAAIVWRLTRQRRLALVAGLLSACLPATSMAVMWISVADPIAAIPFLATILLWVIHLQERRRIWYGLAIGAFVLAMTGKEFCVLLPPILFLIERLVLNQPFNLSDVARRYSVFVILLIPYLIYEYSFQVVGPFVKVAGYSLGPHILSNLASYLAVFAAPWLLYASVAWNNYVWLAFAVGLYIVGLVRTRSRGLVFLGIAPILVILPVLGFGTVWFDPRYLYVPLLAGAVLFAVLIERGWSSLRRFSVAQWVFALALGLVVLVNSSTIASSADGWAEFTRQRRVPFNDIARQHPTFPPNTYLYFLESKPVPLFDLSVTFLLKYGKQVVVEGIDANQIPRWQEFPQAYLYYFNEHDKPIGIAVEPALWLESSPAMPIDFPVPIRLEGFQLARGNLRRGEPLVLILDWRALGKIDQDYTVFVHLIDSGGQMVAGYDSQPRGGNAPTSQWRINQLVVDAITIPIDENVPAGKDYRLEVGVYYLPTQQRIGDTLTIRSINVSE